MTRPEWEIIQEVIHKMRYSPGVLGMETQLSQTRIEGVRITSAWLEDSLAAIAEPDTVEDVRRMAMLTRWLEKSWKLGATVPQRVRVRFEQTAAAVAEAFPKLTGPEQAWLVAVMPHTPRTMGSEMPSTLPIQQMAHDSSERLVQFTYLLHHLESPNDPLLTSLRQSEDEDLRQAAENWAKLVELRSRGLENR